MNPANFTSKGIDYYELHDQDVPPSTLYRPYPSGINVIEQAKISVKDMLMGLFPIANSWSWYRAFNTVSPPGVMVPVDKKVIKINKRTDRRYRDGYKVTGVKRTNKIVPDPRGGYRPIRGDEAELIKSRAPLHWAITFMMYAVAVVVWAKLGYPGLAALVLMGPLHGLIATLIFRGLALDGKRKFAKKSEQGD